MLGHALNLRDPLIHTLHQRDKDPLPSPTPNTVPNDSFTTAWDITGAQDLQGAEPLHLEARGGSVASSITTVQSPVEVRRPSALESLNQIMDREGGTNTTTYVRPSQHQGLILETQEMRHLPEGGMRHLPEGGGEMRHLPEGGGER